MPYTTVVAGTVITASWANANVRDQVVTPFASSAARASAITSPVAGMLTYRTDVKRYEGYDGVAWEGIPMRLTAFKTADEVINNTATLQNDDALAWPLQANAAYSIDLHMRYSANAAADLKIGWSGPAGITMSWSLITNDASLVATVSGDYGASDTPALGGATGSNSWAHTSGIVATAGTAGTLTLQWAQLTAHASNATMFTNSYGHLTRVA